MTLANPLPLGDFFRDIPVLSMKFRLAYNQQVSRQGTKGRLVADLSDPYWLADVVMRDRYNRDALAIQAKLSALDGGINDFYMFDTRCEYPRMDPDGSILGASAPEIISFNSNNKELKIGLVTTGYIFSPGDMLHFNYGPSNTYRSLHQIVVGGTADGSGETGWMEVRPHFEPDLTAGKSVTLIRASARMKLMVDTFDPGTAEDLFTRGFTFSCAQVP